MAEKWKMEASISLLTRIREKAFASEDPSHVGRKSLKIRKYVRLDLQFQTEFYNPVRTELQIIYFMDAQTQMCISLFICKSSHTVLKINSNFLPLLNKHRISPEAGNKLTEDRCVLRVCFIPHIIRSSHTVSTVDSYTYKLPPMQMYCILPLKTVL